MPVHFPSGLRESFKHILTLGSQFYTQCRWCISFSEDEWESNKMLHLMLADVHFLCLQHVHLYSEVIFYQHMDLVLLAQTTVSRILVRRVKGQRCSWLLLAIGKDEDFLNLSFGGSCLGLGDIDGNFCSQSRTGCTAEISRNPTESYLNLSKLKFI